MIKEKNIERHHGYYNILFICSCDYIQETEVTDKQTKIDSFPCEVCGSHGNESITIICENCGEAQYIELREW